MTTATASATKPRPSRADKLPYRVLANSDHDREHWLLARSAIITASDVATVLGIVPGLPKLWYEKKGLLERADISDLEHVQMGHDLEEPNAMIFARKTRRKVKRCQELLCSKRYPWLGATIDYTQDVANDSVGLTFDDSALSLSLRGAPLELKTSGSAAVWSDDEGPHMKFQAQLQAQMIVVDSQWGSLSAILGSPVMRHRWLDLPRHNDLCTMIVEKTHEFHESLKTGEPPVDDDDSTSWALRHLTLDVLAGTTVSLPAIAIEWTDRLAQATEARAQWAKRETYYKNLIMTAIGDAETGLLPDGSSAWKFAVENRREHVVKASSARVLRPVKA
jgi:putative phage-type endonuclease